MKPINLVLLDTDLRVHDHAPLYHAIEDGLPVVACYGLPDHALTLNSDGFQTIQNPRLRFIVESLLDLKQSLKALQIPLYVAMDNLDQWIGQMSSLYKIQNIYYHIPIASYEMRRIAKIKSLFPNIIYHGFYGDTLYHMDDLGLTMTRIQKTFTLFRQHVEKKSHVRPCIPVPKPLPTPFDIPFQDDLDRLMQHVDFDQPYFMKGGETEALYRLHDYIFTSKHIAHYKYTRNHMSHFDDSSKLSPYLALGSLSPRLVYHQVKAYETLHKKSISSYWLIFELIWRDYFHFLHRKHQDRFFNLHGLFNVSYDVMPNPGYIEAWMKGETGLPLVDANMKELKTWGWMSNRGRQNVASFFGKYLKQDWRIGARWFESLLIDYDVSSNWGNWQYNAGVGVDPREDRMFDVTKQAINYDSNATYISHWIPALKKLPTDLRFTPFGLSLEEQKTYDFYLDKDYPRPIINHPLINRYMNDK